MHAILEIAPGTARCRNVREQAVDLCFGVIEMGGDAEAAFAEGNFGLVINAKILENSLLLGGGETYDAAPIIRAAWADNGVTFFFQARAEAIGQRAQSL